VPPVPRHLSFSFLALAALASASCSPSPELREWTPADHGQEPQAQPNPQQAQAQPRPAASGSAVAALYRMSCASCHGTTGAGDGPHEPEGVALADFRDANWQASQTDEALGMVIRAGRDDPDHAFGERLGEAGVRALVQHVRAFAAAP